MLLVSIIPSESEVPFKGLFASPVFLLLQTIFYLLNSAAMLPSCLSHLYCYANSFPELANYVNYELPPRLPRPSRMQTSFLPHPYAVQMSYARVNQHFHSLAPPWCYGSALCYELRIRVRTRQGPVSAQLTQKAVPPPFQAGL